MDNSIRSVKTFYDQASEEEWGRMDRNFFEFEVTKAYLRKYIKPGDRVLDVGGGPGRYSFWLMEQGAKPTLVDLSDGNIALAKKIAAERGVDLEAVQGDARFVDGYTEGLYDHVLLMGPLYHLLKEEDRIQAVNACLKRLKPGGMLYCAFISNYANLVWLLSKAPDLINDERETAWLAGLKKGVDYAGPAFTEAFFIQPAGIDPFMAQFPLTKKHLFSCEGIAAAFQPTLGEMPEKGRESWLTLCLALCEREEIFSWAEHLMYVGEKQG